MAENDHETAKALIDTLISTLKQGQMWTERRDSADCLAEVAKRIVTALEDVIESEKDVDVLTACEQALNAVREHLKLAPVQVQAPAPAPIPEAAPTAAEGPPVPTQVPPTATEQPVSLAEIVRSDIEGPGVTVAETEDGYEIVTRLESGRFQKVHLAQSRDDAKGIELIHIFTVCGPANSRVFKWALEANSKLMHGAIAIRTLGGKEMLIITDTYQAATAGREQIRDAVLAIAETGDVIEKGLTRVDTL